MFDPMGKGRIMRDTVFLPESVIDDRDQAARLVARA
jgi:hypothetical protein